MTKNLEKSKKSKALRRRGKRGEYLLRNYLRTLGYVADRVPGSGAFSKLPGDVTATKNGKTTLFEVKNWTKKFQCLYQLYEDHVRTYQDDVLAIALPGAGHLCVSISTSHEALGDAEFYTIDHRYPAYEKHKQAFKKLHSLEKFVKQSEILAIKDDRKPFLFMRFR